VYTALLTQSGNDNNNTTYGNAGIIKGITYYISTNPDNYDLTIYGSPNNIEGTSFIANQTITLPYTNTLQLNFNDGAPVANVLENTIGNVWFGFNSNGEYNIFFNPSASENKIYSTIEQFSTNLDGQGNLRNGIFTIDSSTIRINTQSSGDGKTWDFQNNILDNTPIEIRVYN
jgi:hypothetical protein